MASVSETIVREFLEIQGFFVRQQRKFVSPRGAGGEDVDFLALNPAAVESDEPRPFVLGAADMKHIKLAVVAVRGWHTEVFSPGVLSNAPEILRFTTSSSIAQAKKAMGTQETPLRLLVLPGLPQNEELRSEAIAWLREKGVNGALPFPVILSHLVQQVEANRNYQKSDLLQILRILKNYDLFRDPQMELFKTRRRKSAPRSA